MLPRIPWIPVKRGTSHALVWGHLGTGYATPVTCIPDRKPTAWMLYTGPSSACFGTKNTSPCSASGFNVLNSSPVFTRQSLHFPHAASLLKYFEVLEPISAIGLSCSFTTHSLYKCSVQSVSYVTDNLEVFVWNYLGLAGCNSVQCRDSATN